MRGLRRGGSCARSAAALAALLLSAGCLGFGGEGEERGGPGGPTPSPVRVAPPAEGGGHAACASSSAQQLALGFTGRAVPDAMGRGAGLHRLDASTFLWVWASYENTTRQDRVSRVNEGQAFQEHDGRLVLCTRVDVVAPMEVDGRERTYAVAVRFTSHGEVPPDAPLRFVVNWVAGCGACPGGPRTGNTTAEFPPQG